MNITMNWNELDINEITNLFLYGSLNTPANLQNESLLKHESVELTLTDVASFMTSGPGRFANAAQSPLVQAFMDGSIMPNTGTVQTMTVEQLVTATTGYSRFFSLSQVEYGINDADFDLRAYIYGHTLFAIDKNAVFTVDTNGTRHIENLAILPGSDDFDFKTTKALQTLGELLLEDKIDPSHIGLTVEMLYDKDSEQVYVNSSKVSYTMTSYLNEVDKNFNSNYPLPIVGESKFGIDSFSLVTDLLDSGVIRFLDTDHKPILYGSDGDDIIFGTQSRTHVDIADITHPLRGWTQYGIHSIGGAGNDKLVGTDYDDKLYGGDGNDLLDGLSGNDTLVGGQGHDRLLGEDGNDTYLLQRTGGGIDTILDHSGADQLQIDGAAVSGVFRPTFDGGQIYYSADKTYELRQMPDGDWRVSARDAATGEYHAVADIDRWQAGEFGITKDTAAPVDRAVWSYPASPNYLNMNGAGAPNGVQFDGGTKSDSFNGSAQGDLIDTGGGLGNYVLANGGDDQVRGGDSRDFIRTGANGGSTTLSDNGRRVRLRMWRGNPLIRRQSILRQFPVSASR